MTIIFMASCVWSTLAYIYLVDVRQEDAR